MMSLLLACDMLNVKTILIDICWIKFNLNSIPQNRDKYFNPKQPLSFQSKSQNFFSNYFHNIHKQSITHEWTLSKRRFTYSDINKILIAPINDSLLNLFLWVVLQFMQISNPAPSRRIKKYCRRKENYWDFSIDRVGERERKRAKNFSITKE